MNNPLATVSLGLRYMILSALFFSMMSTLVKLGGQTMHSMQLVLARCLVAFVMSYIAIRRLGINPFGQAHRKLLILRGVLGFTGLCCFYYALTKLPLGEVTVIQYTNPMLTAFVASLWLKERLGKAEFLGVLGSLIGVVLIARPTFIFGGAASDFAPLALAAACTGAVVSSFAYTTVRALSGKAHAMVVVFYFPLIATPIALPASLPYLKVPTWQEWLILLGVGLTTQIAQVYMTRGLHLEKAGRAMSVTYLQIVFAFIWGVLLFDEVPSLLSCMGALIILASAIFVSRSRAMPSAPAPQTSAPDRQV